MTSVVFGYARFLYSKPFPPLSEWSVPSDSFSVVLLVCIWFYCFSFWKTCFDSWFPKVCKLWVHCPLTLTFSLKIAARILRSWYWRWFYPTRLSSNHVHLTLREHNCLCTGFELGTAVIILVASLFVVRITWEDPKQCHCYSCHMVYFILCHIFCNEHMFF